MKHPTRTTMLEQDGPCLARVCIIKGMQLPVAYLQYLPATLMLLLWRDSIGYLQGLGAWTLAITEYVILAYIH